jgi:SAM-dependent methyltransferase
MAWYEKSGKSAFMQPLIKIASKLPDAYSNEIVRTARRFTGSHSIVLDVGCGSGNILRKLSPYVGQCIGIDYFIESKSEKNMKFLKHNIESKIPLKGGISHFTICSEVLEHISNDNKLFSELVRLTKKGGKILLITPNKNFLKKLRFSKEKNVLEQQGHVRLGYSLENFVDLSKKYHLKILFHRYKNTIGWLIDFCNFVWPRYEKFSVIFLTPIFRVINYFQSLCERNKNIEGGDLIVLFEKL